MKLQDIKDAVGKICLSHRRINDFNYGEEFVIDDLNNGLVQQAFLEMPYTIAYDDNNRFKNYGFALLILSPSNGQDGDDHRIISETEGIADAIFKRLSNELKSKGVSVSAINGVSLRNMSSSDLSGVRFEFQVKTSRIYCDDNYIDEFDRTC